MASKLEAALHYAEKFGIRVIPLKPHDKNPLIKDWVNLASADPEQIAKWWGVNPERNVGGLMGDIVCLDFDVDEGYDSRDFLAGWEMEHGKLPETATAVTGRGGMHLFYRVGRPVASSTNGELHIDIRGLGSQAMLAPSVHPNGNEVFWDLDPDDVGFAQADENVHALIEAVRPKKRKHEKISVPKGGVSEGGRNSALFKLACSMQSQSWPDEAIRSAVDAYNRTECRPPLPTEEVDKLLDSALSHTKGHSPEALAKEAQQRKPRFMHNKVGRQLIDEYGACLIEGETPAIRTSEGRYRMGWDAFDSVIIDLHDDCKESNRREVKAYIKAKAPSREQSPANLIAFRNGVLDVSTMEFRDYRRDDVIPNVIPHNWNPDAKSDVLDRTLEKMACGDFETLVNLTEFLGMCMMRDAKTLPYFPVLIGEGSNGKSTYIELIENVLGRENISGLQPKEISAHFMGMHIVGKTANLGDDIEDGFLDTKDCSVIKSVATGDLMFTDVKGTKGFHFRPYCTMVFSCNNFPRLADTSKGFMRRLFPVEFNAYFSRDDPDFDPQIGSKLKAEEALEHACVLGVEGLRRAIAQNGPTPNAMSQAMKAEIAREGNTGLQWINDDGITAEQIAGLTKEEAYAKYLAWCERNGYSRTAMGSGALSALFGTYFRLKCSKTGHREVHGVRKTVKVYEYKVPKGAM